MSGERDDSLGGLIAIVGLMLVGSSREEGGGAVSARGPAGGLRRAGHPGHRLCVLGLRGMSIKCSARETSPVQSLNWLLLPYGLPPTGWRGNWVVSAIKISSRWDGPRARAEHHEGGLARFTVWPKYGPERGSGRPGVGACRRSRWRASRWTHRDRGSRQDTTLGVGKVEDFTWKG